MSDLEARYRQLLRWYPRSWRTAHGEVLIGTAMDAADAEGRSHPTSAEARSIALHGLGERFTLRTALVAAVGALLFAFVGTLVLLIGIGTVAQVGGGWIPLALTLLAAPVCASTSALALLRHRGLRPDRVLPALTLTVLAWGCAFLSAWAWSVGFDEGDAGLARTPFSLAFGVFFFAAWIFGGAAIALVVSEMTRALPRAARWAVSGMAAVVCPPVFGFVAYQLISGLAVGLALTAISAIVLTRDAPAQADAIAIDSVHAVPSHLRRRVGRLALLVVVLSVPCATFALTGSSILSGVDPTRAMRIGLGAGALTAIPLVIAIAWLLSRRRPEQAGLIACGAVLIVLGTSAYAVTLMFGAASSGDIPWAAVVPLAIGVGAVTAALVRATPALRGLLAGAASVTALLPVWLVVASAGFIVPFAAAGLAAWALRRPKGPTPQAFTRKARVP